MKLALITTYKPSIKESWNESVVLSADKQILTKGRPGLCNFESSAYKTNNKKQHSSHVPL